MEKTLAREAKTQLANSLRRRYQAASSRSKKQILGEFVAVSGYHPKYAIHLLNAAEPSASARRGRVRPTLYDEAAKQALIVLWEALDRVLQSLEADPDQTSQELLAAFMIRYPSRYDVGHLRTVQRRMMIWRPDAVQRLIIEMGGLTEDVSWNSECYPGK